MSESSASIPLTPVRAAYERVQRLSLGAQIEDCADLIGHPEVLAGDVRDSLRMIARWREAAGPPGEPPELAAPDEDQVFYPEREIAVIGEPCAFTCLATDVDPLAEADDANPRVGVDYVGVTCDASRTPVLGVVQSPRDASAYPMLLRGLAALVEIAPPEQLAFVNRWAFRGLLGERPAIDLDLVLHDEWELGERTTLEQMTRDLSERAATLLRAEGAPVRSVVCLRLNPERFDGRLRFVWRV